MATERDKLSYLALYISIPIIALLAFLVIVFLCCLRLARKHRLNWFERSVLESLGDGEVQDTTEKDFLHRSFNKDRYNRDGCGGGGGIVNDVPQTYLTTAESQDSLTTSNSGVNKHGSTITEDILTGNLKPTVSYSTTPTVVRQKTPNEQYQPSLKKSRRVKATTQRNQVRKSPIHIGAEHSTADDQSPTSSDSGVGGAAIMTSQYMKHRNNSDRRVSFKTASPNPGTPTSNGVAPGAANSIQQQGMGYNPSPRRASLCAAPLILPGASGSRRGSSGGSTGSVSDRRDSAEFWVPPVVMQRRTSLAPSLGLARQHSSDEESKPIRPGSGSDDLATSQSDIVFDESAENDWCPLVESVSHVQVPAGPQRGRRRASMQDALDPTLINAKMYEQLRLKSQLENKQSIDEDETIGVLHLSLDYDPGQSVLTCRIIAARDLQPRDFSGTCDPYCRLSLESKSKRQNNPRQTRVHKNTVNPDFNEEFIFSVHSYNMDGVSLNVLVYEFDEFSRDECVGQVVIPLDSLDLKMRQELWRGIEPHRTNKLDQDFGDLMFSMGFLPSAERLTVSVLKARNLVQHDSKAPPSPFVKVTLQSSEKRIKKKKTSTIRNNGKPVWNEALVFSNVAKSALPAVTLEITVYNDGVLGTSEVLGRVVIGPDSRDEEREHRGDMLNCKTASARWHKLTNE